MLTELSQPRLQITAVELTAWIAVAKPGDTLAYHRGFVLMDRVPIGSRLCSDDSEELDHIATAVMAMAETGQVHLIQRRHGPYDYTYIIVAAGNGGRRGSDRRAWGTT